MGVLWFSFPAGFERSFKNIFPAKESAAIFPIQTSLLLCKDTKNTDSIFHVLRKSYKENTPIWIFVAYLSSHIVDELTGCKAGKKSSDSVLNHSKSCIFCIEFLFFWFELTFVDFLNVLFLLEIDFCWWQIEFSFFLRFRANF